MPTASLPRLPTLEELARYVARHKVVTEAARCRVPSLVHLMAPPPPLPRGSWWSWPGANRIYNRLGALHERDDVLVCRLVRGKVTYVHAGAWPALVRLRDVFAATALDRVSSVHGANGRHTTHVVPLDDWLAPAVAAAARALDVEAAHDVLADGVPDAAALFADLGLPARAPLFAPVRRPHAGRTLQSTVHPRDESRHVRVFNFSAGPAVLPEEVLRKAAAEMLDWHGSGMSVMEMSHRGKEFISIADKAEADLRTLLAIPASYKVLFLQGGAIAENAIIPMNLLAGHAAADYVNTGEWSKKSIKEARKYTSVHVAASAEDERFTYVPAQATWSVSPGTAYVHVCTNETIGGVEYQWTPDTGDVPLVADMSSHILSRAVDVSRYGVIYGGAQKNIGPAGLTLVIVREDLLDRALPITPSAFHWQEQAAADSMLNTPPTYAIYVAGLVFEWLLAQGGVPAIEARNVAKAKLLYDCLDALDFYVTPVRREDRSRMNVPFKLRDESLDAKFLDGAKARGMVQLKGHRAVGGMRASIYNAMPQQGVQALCDYLREFAQANG
jgi:phosphoserine aminotransferase